MISMLFYTFFKEHELYNKLSISFNDVKEVEYKITIKDTKAPEIKFKENSLERSN